MIELDKIDFGYAPGKLLFQSFQFAVQPGEFVWIQGPNGCGKSTLLMLIAGLLLPDSGRLVVFGKHYPEQRKEILTHLAYIMPTGQGLIEHLSLAENIRIFGLYLGQLLTLAEMQTLAAQVALDIHHHDPISKYSTGMRQRANLAIGMLKNPELYLIDEPFGGMDKQGKQDFRGNLESLKQVGKTILVVSHEDEGLSTLATRTIDFATMQLHKQHV